MRESIQEITEYMREHASRDLTIGELAQYFGYSKFHFSREFKKSIGVTPNEYWAALKMEQSILSLDNSTSILNAHLEAGYESTGTFTSNFVKNTGLTPGQFQTEMQRLGLYEVAKGYEAIVDGTVATHYSFNRKDPATHQEHRLFVECNAPEGFKGLIFVGMFVKPLPNHAPMIGKAMTHTRSCIIDQIPNGEYYPLVCAIKSSLNPLDYFHLDSALRDLRRTPYRFPLKQDEKIVFNLREAIPTDPAIPLSPVKLLADALRRKQ